MVADLVADDRADPAVIDRRVGVRIEERRLEDRGGKDDLVPRRVGIGVDRHRRHAPLGPVDRLAEFVEVALEFEPRRALGVAERVAADDLEVRIVAPLRRVADLRREHRELGARLNLGALVHPRQLPEARVHRRDDVADEFVGLGLGFGGEILGDVELADRLAERVGGRIDPALPPLLIGWLARQDGS